MSQRRTHSFYESVANTAVGFILSLLVWTFIIVPIWKIPVSMDDNLVITGIFTVFSIARGYVIRRIGNVYSVRQQKQREGAHDHHRTGR